MSDTSVNDLISLIRESSTDDSLKSALSGFLEMTATAINPEQVRTLYELYNIKHSFKCGDVVRWKKGLQDKKFPRENDPAIVMEVLDQPVFDNQNDAGSPYFRESYDVVLGLIDSDGDFLKYHFNSCRFEPFK